MVHQLQPQSKGLLAKRAGTRNPKLRQLSHLPWAIGRSKANIVQICNTFWTRQNPPDLWNAEDQAFPAFLCSAPCWLADRCARGHSWIRWPSKWEKIVALASSCGVSTSFIYRIPLSSNSSQWGAPSWAQRRGKLVWPGFSAAPAVGGMDPCLAFQEVEECVGTCDVDQVTILELCKKWRETTCRSHPRRSRFGSITFILF